MTLSEALALRGDHTLCTSAIILRGNKVLLGLMKPRPEKGRPAMWGTPGGRNRDNESVEEGLRRETFEEVGITDLSFIHFLCDVPGRTPGDRLIAIICASDQNPILKEPDVFSEWRWTPVTEFPADFINPTLREKFAAYVTNPA